MHSHWLILEGDRSEAAWRLEWDEARFVLRDPDGQAVFDAQVAYAHRSVELYELFVERKISFASPHGSLAFQKNPSAHEELRQFVENGLGSDAEYRSQLRRHSLRSVWLGLAMFIVAGCSFGLYCWYASWAPDPPPGHWMRWFGWLIYGVLVLLLAAALAGPYVAYLGVRQWLRIRRIENAVKVSGARNAP